jgi:four helix bundle protein
MNQFSNKKYDLEERTAEFGKAIIVFCKNLRQDVVSKPLISQLVRSATSIGANYVEANGGSSRRDFTNKIFICKKEAQETRHWLKMIQGYFPEKEPEIKPFMSECHELILIFQKITATLKLPEKIKNYDIEN